MSVNDPIGDLLTRIRNSQMRRKSSLTSPASTMRARVLDVLLSEGYIRSYEKIKDERNHDAFRIELKYHEGRGVIREIKRVSKPGRRVYSSVADIPRIADGLGIVIVSTPRGVMTDHQARESNVGGELLCTVF
jgi:small subunit ribosomal protein S8